MPARYGVPFQIARIRKWRIRRFLPTPHALKSLCAPRHEVTATVPIAGADHGGTGNTEPGADMGGAPEPDSDDDVRHFDDDVDVFDEDAERARAGLPPLNRDGGGIVD